MVNRHLPSAAVAWLVLLVWCCSAARTEEGKQVAATRQAVDKADAVANEGYDANGKAEDALDGLDFGEDQPEPEQSDRHTNNSEAGNLIGASNQTLPVIPIPARQDEVETTARSVSAFTSTFFRSVDQRDREARNRTAPERLRSTGLDRRSESNGTNDERTDTSIPPIRGVPVDAPDNFAPRPIPSLNLKQGRLFQRLYEENSEAAGREVAVDANDIFSFVYDNARKSPRAFEDQGIGTSGVLGISGIRDSKGFFPAGDRASRPKKGEIPPPQLPEGNGSLEEPRPREKMISVLLEKGVRMEFRAEMLQRARLSDHELAAAEDRLLKAKTPDELQAAVDSSTKEIVKAAGLATEGRTMASVTAVSLRQLCEQAERYRDRWDKLPDEIHFPGNLRRIVGYVVSADGNDLFIFGDSAGNGAPMDIDDLIVGLNSVWAKGKFPRCSLDPDPSDFSGPQWSRIEGIPMHTEFALAMLEADYDMKKLFIGTMQVDMPGFRNWPHAYSQQPEGFSVPERARFWFRPTDLPPGAIRVSPRANLALFDSLVMIDTEIMNVNMRGSSRRHPIDVALTGFVTAHLREFEGEIPSFARLHTLFDVVLLAKLLRSAEPEHGLLKRLIQLPTRKTTVPDSYPGITVPIVAEGRRLGSINGGVNMSAGVRNDTIVQVSDPRVERLTRRLDSTKVASTLDDADLELPKTEMAQTAQGATNLGRFYWERAVARHRAQLFWLAERELNLARSYGVPSVNCDEFDLLIRYDRGDFPNANGLSVEQRDSLHYILLSRAANSDDAERALKDVNVAIRLIPDNASEEVDEYFHRRLRASILCRLKRFSEAIDKLDELVEQRPNDYRALWVRSHTNMQLGRYKQAYDDADAAVQAAGKNAAAHYYIQRALALFEIDNTASEKLEADFRRAVELEPRNPEVHLFWARYLAFEGDIDGAVSVCGKAIRYGGRPEAYFTRAKLLLRGSRPVLEEPKFDADGMKDLNWAIRVDPTMWEARQLRAELLASIFRNFGQVGSDANFRRYTELLFEAYEGQPLSGEFWQIAKRLSLLADTPDAQIKAVSAMLKASVELCAWDFEQAAEYAPERWKKALNEQSTLFREIHRQLLAKEEKP